MIINNSNQLFQTSQTREVCSLETEQLIIACYHLRHLLEIFAQDEGSEITSLLRDLLKYFSSKL
jgi:hypothetical protein